MSLSLSRRLVGAGLLLAVMLSLSACALPDLAKRDASFKLPQEQTRDTAIGQAVQAVVAKSEQDKSGIHPLVDAHDAFAARMLLARNAERSLDVQYYIWRDDITGKLLLRELYQAAERGVRVRLLLDDHGTYGLDHSLAVLAAHKNIEVRLFNPFVFRYPKILGFITDFSRANRRMHNKSFTVDNQASIVGGRNIGDEYFGAGDGMLFADLDVLAIGPIVDEVSRDFDAYWQSQSSYPASTILPEPLQSAQTWQQALTEKIEAHPLSPRYIQAVKHSAFIDQLLNQRLELEWARTHIVSDDPAKGVGKSVDDGYVLRQLETIIGEPEREVDLVSPYFVPTQAGLDYFSYLTQQGVTVRILTNSLAATDVTAVHAGYARYRKALLRAGVELYEMRPFLDYSEKEYRAGPFGSSGSSLHAKTFAVDAKRVFVGSLNFDPRSANLNTELGFIIESPNLAKKIEDVFDDSLLEFAYQVRLNSDGSLYWLERVQGEPVYHSSEPRAGFWRRMQVFVFSLLPIEWLL